MHFAIPGAWYASIKYSSSSSFMFYFAAGGKIVVEGALASTIPGGQV